MAIYNHPSWVYFNDAEFFEMLSNLGHRELLKVGRARGLIFSEKSNDEVVRSALSLLPSNWPLIEHIYHLIAKPDPAERKSGLHVQGCDPATDLHTLATAVRDSRATKNEEEYVVNQDANGATRLTVSYTETDLSKALQYSRRKRTVEIEMVKDGNTISFNHDATDKARTIVKELENRIQPAKNAKIQEEVISLKGIHDAALRTQFFTELLKGITGQSFKSTSHVIVDCRLGDSVDDNGDDDAANQKANKRAKEIKGIINKMAFTGEQVLMASLYQQAAETGYFITQINWTTESKSEPGKFFDYVAGFGDPISCDHFSSDVTKRWQRNADDADKSETLSLSAVERRTLNALVQASSENAFAIVTKAHAEASKTPKKK